MSQTGSTQNSRLTTQNARGCAAASPGLGYQGRSPLSSWCAQNTSDMLRGMTRLLSITAATVVLATSVAGPQPALGDFFRDFTAEWVRGNPNLATSSRYFTGLEQDRLERQLTPVTAVWRRDRIRLARKGLTELRKFDRSHMTETERVSAELMDW